MFRVAIIDDEENQFEIIRQYLLRYSKEKDVEFEIEWFPDAINFVSDYHFGYDIIFLDIMMPDLNGMKAAERLRKVDDSVAIIFVTCMSQYAIQGYDVSAKYFMVKPIAYPDFAVKIGNTLGYILKENTGDFLMLNTFSGKRKVFTKNIKYIEVFAHDVVFHLSGEEIHIRGTLSEYEKKLNLKKFCRINSCYLINLDYVTAVNDRTVVIGGTELQISYTRKKVMMKALAEYAALGVPSGDGDNNGQ